METENRIRRLFRGDGVAIGAESTIGSASLVELYGRIGLDFVWSDFEHQGRSPQDSQLLEHQVRAAELTDTELLVRIPSVDTPLIRKVLDTGVQNLLVPRVESAEEVRTAVRAARFHIDGKPCDRGLGNGRANVWGTEMDGFLDREDENVLVGAMIENPTAVEHIEEILSVPELGFVFLGPWDISHAVGHPMETDHPAVTSAIETTSEACRSAGVPFGGYFPDPEDAREARQAGAQLLLVGDEVTAVCDTFNERLESIRSDPPASE